MPMVKVLSINKDDFKENQAKKQDKCIIAFRKLKGYRDKEDWSQGPILVYKNIMLITDIIIILIFLKPGELEGEEVKKAVGEAVHSKP